MKKIIISYSLTGRNAKLAELSAAKLGLEHIRIKELKQRKQMTVAWDLLFKRTPKTQPAPDVMDKCDMVIFFAPVWMGMAATPLNAYLKHIKKTGKKYAYISLSGGCGESNPLLRGDIIKKTGAEPAAFLDLHVADLMEQETLTRQQTEAYSISEAEYEMLCGKVVEGIGNKE